MPKNHAIARVAARPRFRSTITTIMLILMTVMILRDIIVRHAALALAGAEEKPVNRTSNPQ
jgi:hypothetical protein